MPRLPPSPRTPAARVAAAVTLLALALRGLAAWRWGGEVAGDVDMYRALAASLLDGKGYVSPETGVATAFRPPLVPLIFAALGNVGWALLLYQALAGAATAGLTVRLGGRLGLGWQAAGLAGVVVACDPILLRYTPRPMTEVTAALLSVALLCRLVATRVPRVPPADTRDACRHVLTGLLFGLTALCRPTAWAFGALLAAAWAFDRLRGRAGWLHAWPGVAAGVLGTLLVVGPWVGRNAQVLGRPVLTTTHGGYTLHLANNPIFYGEVVRGPVGAVWDGGSLERWQERQRAAYRREFNVGGLDTNGRGYFFPPREGWEGSPNDVPYSLFSAETLFRGQGDDAESLRLTWTGGDNLRVEWGPRDRWSPADELRRDRWHRDRALETIRADPLGFARAVPVRVSRLWGPAPLGEAAAGLPRAAWWAVAAWNAAVFLLALAGAVRVYRGRTRPACAAPAHTRDACGHEGNAPNWRPVFLLIASVTLVHAIYWSNARMRAPLVPAIAVLAGAGLASRRRVVSPAPEGRNRGFALTGRTGGT